MEPIYVEVKNERLERTLATVKDLMAQIEKETTWLKTKEPMLCAVPAPDNDCMSIGGFVVYGVSSLNEERKNELKEFLLSLWIRQSTNS